MPNAFISGMANNQASLPQGGAVDPNKPWTSAPRFIGAGSGPNDQYLGNEAKQNGNIKYNATGAQGAGYYSTNTGDDTLHQQQYFTNQFRQNIPQLENTLGHQMGSQISGAMGQGIKNTRQSNSNRGLLYGGINAGQEGGVRARAAGQMAEGRSNINASVNQAANSMDNEAIQTGLQIQQQQQQMQNAIYSQALAKMNSQNAAVGGLMGAGGAVAGGYLAGGL